MKMPLAILRDDALFGLNETLGLPRTHKYDP